MTMIERLLVLAEKLAEEGARSLTLKRRAISTAYYAVFHSLAELCATEILGDRSDVDEQSFVRVYRALDHGTLKTAFISDPLKTNPAIQKIGNRVVELQSERIRSDYLPSKRLYNADECRAFVRSARWTVDAITALHPKDRKTLAVFLLFKNR